MTDITKKTKSVGEFVANNYRTAAVFQKYGIDFCCNGGKTINEVCESRKIAADELLTELHDVLRQSNDQSMDYQSWPLDLLADYIEKRHHRYVEKAIPPLNQFLEKLCRVHGAHHPELFEIKEQFDAAARELTMHMRKEEIILFPYIKKMVAAKYTHGQKAKPGFDTVQNPINMMMEEHNIEGERFRQIAGLSNNYKPPADACNTYRVAFPLLKEFEEDLHLHIHLENNILFPKSVILEKKLNV